MQRAPVLAFAAAIGRLTTTLALARVLAFATVVTVLATTLTLTLVLSLATVLTFLVICHSLQRNAHFRARARGVGTHREGSAQQAGHRRAGNDCSGCIVHTFFVLAVCSLTRRMQQREERAQTGLPVSLRT